MAMLDRLKDAARSTNSIEAVQPVAAPQRPMDLHGANPVGPSDPPPAARKAPADPKAPAYTTEPEAISRAYYVEDRGGERRFYDDYQRKSLAIRANDASISTKKEDLNTIRAMLTMAEARGWSEVKIAGTADFKREAWIEAQARGITAQGHKASDLDRQEADRRRAERGQAPVQAGPKQDTNEVKPAAGLAAQVPPPPATQAAAPAAAPQREAEPSRELPSRSKEATPAPVQGLAQPSAAPVVNHRQALKDATAELSPDGRLVLAALSEKIDRQMNKLNADAKLETKAFAATELVKKEKMEGPVVLSPELRKLATAPEPAQAKQAPAPVQQPVPVRQVEPPQRSRSR